jgi:F-type H+-transporting ATPase subunit delta
MFLARFARAFASVKTDHLVVRMYSPTLRILDGAEDVEQILYDSLDGGKSIINSNFMIVQSTLKPGMIEIVQKGGQSTKYIISGGVIQKNPNNSVDIALFEAYGKNDIDWEALKKSDAFV